MPTIKDWSPIAMPLVAAVALTLVGNMDAQEAEHAQSTYCEMVALWDKDAAIGITPEKRTGWPPYDGRKQCN